MDSVQAGVRQATHPAAGVAAKKPKNNIKSLLLTVVVIVLLAVIGLLGWKYTQAQATLKKLSNPTEAAKAETSALVAKVAKVVELPRDETPTVATVVDAAKLKAQAFFANAKNGDKVLMYTKAKKAYLFRVETGKLIEVAPINIDAAQPAAVDTTKTTVPATTAPKKP